MQLQMGMSGPKKIPFITLSNWTEKESLMDNIRIIYRILKVLKESMYTEEMDGRII